MTGWSTSALCAMSRYEVMRAPVALPTCTQFATSPSLTPEMSVCDVAA